MQTLSAYTDEGHAFFYQLVPYFQSVIVKQGDIIWKQGDEPDGLFIIEDGCLHAVYHYEDHSEFIHEMMMAHTVAGEMTMLSGTKRNATVSAERDSHLWKLDNEGLAKLEKEKPTIARQFVKIAMKGELEIGSMDGEGGITELRSTLDSCGRRSGRFGESSSGCVVLRTAHVHDSPSAHPAQRVV
jgi:CRP-like cAMP-binding protein